MLLRRFEPARRRLPQISHTAHCPLRADHRPLEKHPRGARLRRGSGDPSRAQGKPLTADPDGLT